jgi:hypothetical protein
MDFRSLAGKAKQVIDKRGGTESLKEDAEELKDIAGGGGSLADKAKEAAEAVKDPGAPGPEPAQADRPRREGHREGHRPEEPRQRHHRGGGARPAR